MVLKWAVYGLIAFTALVGVVIIFTSAVSSIVNEKPSDPGQSTTVEQIGRTSVPLASSNIPTFEWTVEELVDCDTTVLAHQMRADDMFSSELSECEMAVLLAQLEAMAVYEDLPYADRQRIARYQVQLEQFNDLVRVYGQDKVVTKTEVSVLCVSGAQHQEWLAEALDYVQVREGLRGLEIDFLKAQQLLNTVNVTCSEVGFTNR